MKLEQIQNPKYLLKINKEYYKEKMGYEDSKQYNEIDKSIQNFER